MDVPVVAAARFKGDIEDADLAGGKGGKIALANKILCEPIIGLANGEHHVILMCFPGMCRAFLSPYLFCHAESCPCFGPAGVKCRVGQDLRNLRPGDPVLFCHHQVVLERGIHKSLRHQGRHSDQRTVPKGQLGLAAPHLSEQNIIVELGKFGGKLPQGISARRLFDCHCIGSFL